MDEEPVEEELRGLPPAAVNRVRHQRASGVRGSLLSAAGAAAVRSIGLEPVGEVFGCVVITLGWAGGSCGYGYGWNAGPGNWSGGVPGTFGGGIGGGVRAGAGWQSPIVVSGDMSSSGSTWSAWSRSYADAVARAWSDAHDRMLAEAKALGADGVLG